MGRNGFDAIGQGVPVASAAEWWTEHGWATHGSKLQTQLYVNRRPQTLTEKVFEALPALAERAPELDWVAPLETARAGVKRFAEPRDRTMLRAPGARLDIWSCAPGCE